MTPLNTHLKTNIIANSHAGSIFQISQIGNSVDTKDATGHQHSTDTSRATIHQYTPIDPQLIQLPLSTYNDNPSQHACLRVTAWSAATQCHQGTDISQDPQLIQLPLPHFHISNIIQHQCFAQLGQLQGTQHQCGYNPTLPQASQQSTSVLESTSMLCTA